MGDQIGAKPCERTPARSTQRNGYWNRTLETRVGEIRLRIPKLRLFTHSPSLLGPRRRSEKALHSVVQQAYVQGVNARKVDDLLRPLSPNHVWSDDFVHDRTYNGAAYRILNIIDEYIREAMPSATGRRRQRP